MRWRSVLAEFVILAALCGGRADASDRTTFHGSFTQGALITARTEPGAEIVLDGLPVRTSPDGVFALGFAYDAPERAALSIRFRDGSREDRTLVIAPRRYDIQRLDGLPPRQVTPAPDDLERIKQERALIVAARAADRTTPWFAGGFVWPVLGPISGVYGSQRILNGEARRPHMGVDVAAPTGTPVVAAADGIVTLARADTFFNGHLVILDHGHGVSTSYAHLSAIEVRTGDTVRQGAPIGRVGATGRVTGAHLHWGLNLFELPLDPALVVPPMTRDPAPPASGDGATATPPAARGSNPR